MSVDVERWQSRVVEHALVAPTELVGNPRNWRLHPKHQSDALTAALDRVGWVQPVIVNRRTGHLVDGHLRVALALNRDEDVVPVDYVDLDPDEEALVLATLDPLAALAGTDEASLKGLMASLDNLDDDLTRMLNDLTGQGSSSAPALPTQEQIDQRADELEHQFDGSRGTMLNVICPDCGHEFAINLEEVAE